ncbi:MAG: DUF2336 domain-containing protein [Alphaproteobacteria bacterium]|nr:DUF2336 domain-containing protein [Alphaproteobacteria bacterium]
MTTIDAAAGPEAPDDVLAEAALAGPASPRALLVRKLIDIVVLPASQISANERSLAGDILLQVVGRVEESLRAEIARRVARVPELPSALLRMLLLDEPLVAREILIGAEHIPEALLIETARLGTTTHRALITRRLNLTTAVADALLAARESEIARQLLKRDDFTLSPHAVDMLVARSTMDAELPALLLRRRELEPAHGFMMFWWVDGERRRRILARFALNRGVIQDALEDLYPRVFRSRVSDPFVKEILIMLERRHRPRGANGEVVSMDMVRRTLHVARIDPSPEAVQAVAMIAGVSVELAARVLRDPGGEPYAVMCKALGIARDDFFAFISHDDQGAEGSFTLARAEELLTIFDSMARDFARAVLRYWDWEGNPRIAGIARLVEADAPPV